MRNHCCEDMRLHLQVVSEQSSWDPGDRPVAYDPVFDEYGLSCPQAPPCLALIRYCPWCRHQLPRSQRDRWFSELARRGLSVDDPQLPAEFRTDRWWLQGHHEEDPEGC